MCRNRVIPVWLGQYHGCWCPGSLCRQVISSHDIDCVNYVGPYLTWGRISTTCVMSVWRNDRNYKYMFMFLLKNLACKELTKIEEKEDQVWKIQQNSNITQPNFIALNWKKKSKWPHIILWSAHPVDKAGPYLTHWGRVTNICISKLTIIGSDNGLVLARWQAIIWTNAGILFTEPLGTNFSGISIKFHTFSFRNMYLKKSSGKWRPFCLGQVLLLPELIKNQ